MFVMFKKGFFRYKVDFIDICINSDELKFYYDLCLFIILKIMLGENLEFLFSDNMISNIICICSS